MVLLRQILHPLMELLRQILHPLMVLQHQILPLHMALLSLVTVPLKQVTQSPRSPLMTKLPLTSPRLCTRRTSFPPTTAACTVPVPLEAQTPKERGTPPP